MDIQKVDLNTVKVSATTETLYTKDMLLYKKRELEEQLTIINNKLSAVKEMLLLLELKI